MLKDRMIQKLEDEIDNYQEAIENAEGALAEAERELQEELEARYGKDLDIGAPPDNIVPLRK